MVGLTRAQGAIVLTVLTALSALSFYSESMMRISALTQFFSVCLLLSATLLSFAYLYQRFTIQHERKHDYIITTLSVLTTLSLTSAVLDLMELRTILHLFFGTLVVTAAVVALILGILIYTRSKEKTVARQTGHQPQPTLARTFESLFLAGTTFMLCWWINGFGIIHKLSTVHWKLSVHSGAIALPAIATLACIYAIYKTTRHIACLGRFSHVGYVEINSSAQSKVYLACLITLDLLLTAVVVLPVISLTITHWPLQLWPTFLPIAICASVTMFMTRGLDVMKRPLSTAALQEIYTAQMGVPPVGGTASKVETVTPGFREGTVTPIESAEGAQPAA